MSVEYGRTSLDGAWMQMRAAWDGAREAWRDGVRARFEEEYWRESEEVVEQARRALHELADAVARARAITL